SGQDIDFETASGDTLRKIEPALSDEIGAGVLLKGQRFVNPGAYAQSLAEAFTARGGKIVSGATVSSIDRRGRETVITLDDSSAAAFDAAVIATGTWLNKLAAPHGVKMRVQA